MSLEQISILHVDDDSQFLDLTRTCLERSNERFSIISEPSAEAGLDQLRQRSFDCIVSDYQMSPMDGLEFCGEVRATYPSIPFILHTHIEPEEIAAKALDAGADDYFKKQVGITQYPLLANKIVTLVKKDKSARRLAYLTEQKHIADGGIYGKEKVSRDEHSDSMSMAVVEAVADHENTDPVALKPLHEAIDPDALDALFPQESDEGTPSTESLTFTYLEYSVTVTSDGSVKLDS